MADPKIRFDIEAATSGDADVNRLASSLERLDSSIDPALAENARKLATDLRSLGQQQEALTEFIQLKQRSAETAVSLEQAQAAAQALAREMAASDAPTRAQIGRLEKLRDAVRAAKDADIQATKALQDQRSALAAAGVDTTKLQAEQSVLRTRQDELAQSAVRVGQRYNEQADAAQASANKQKSANTSVKDSLEGIAGQLRTLQQIAGAAIGGQLLGGLVGQLSEAADQYNNLAARIKIATGEGAGFDQAFQGVFDIALRTNSTLETTGTLFTRIAQAGQQIGLTTQQALALTETINQAVQVSGGSAESADAAITQLIQGLQSGVLRGEEFNSVMEQAPRLAKALADGLGITTGELRKQAEAGRLTSEVVIQALQGQSQVIQGEFAQLPQTVGRAITNLSTAWTQYIGETDKANGASAAAAGAINALARNLDTVAAALYSAGKAVAAYQALKLAQTFLGIGQAAKAATAEVVAMNAATAASGAASAGAAVGAGRFAAILGGIKAFALVAVLTNLKEIGTWLGESVAKWQGYGQAIAYSEERAKLEAEATRQQAAEKAALAQKIKQAADAALGLNAQSQALIGEFEGVIQKGGSVADAMEKVSKSLDLSNIKGITDASAALDALAQRGQIAADQVAKALSSALSGADLGVFQAQAQAAFDGSEQGARRLAAALDAVTAAALDRAGTSAKELADGFSSAASSALNDVDALVAGLQRMGAEGEVASRALGVSLQKALDAASSSTAVEEVIDRYKRLGEQGLITGDQLAQGLSKAQQKLDELKPGINSLDEAFKQLGLTAPAELNRIADNAKTAFQRIANDGTVALAAKQDAFRRYAEAAIASNDQIKISEASLVAGMYDMEVVTDKAGRTIVRVAGDGQRGFDGMTNSVRSAGQQVDSLTSSLDRQNNELERQISAEERALKLKERQIALENQRRNVDANGFSLDMTGKQTVNAAGNTFLSIVGFLKSSGLSDAQAQDVARQFTDSQGNVPYMNNPGQAKYGASTLSEALSKAAQQALFGADMSGATQGTKKPSDSGSSGSTKTIVLKLGSKNYTLSGLSDSNASTIESLFSQLQAEAARAA